MMNAAKNLPITSPVRLTGAVKRHWSVFWRLSSDKVLIVRIGISTKRTKKSIENMLPISVEPYCRLVIENNTPEAAKNAVKKIYPMRELKYALSSRFKIAFID